MEIRKTSLDVFKNLEKDCTQKLTLMVSEIVSDANQVFSLLMKSVIEKAELTQKLHFKNIFSKI